MMRVVGKAGLVAVALSFVATASAMAAGQGLGPISPTALMIPGDSGVSPRDFLGTGFEQSEGFGLGTISNVNSWKCRLQNNVPPLCGGNVVAKGNGSAQSFQLAQNFDYPGGTLAGARSPTITSTSMSTLNWDFRMDDNGGSNYRMQPQASSQALVVSYIIYAYTGYIYAAAYDTIGGTFQGFALGLWNTDWTTYQMVLSHPGFADTNITYYAGPDKNHLTQLCDIVGGQCTFFPAGNQFEETLLISDNFQNTGGGNFAGDGPGVAYVDNIAIKPEPGTLAMLGAGLVLALRRRSGR